MRKIAFLILICIELGILFLATTTPSLAQGATCYGIVADNSGNVIPDVLIDLISGRKNLKGEILNPVSTKVFTDSDGYFEFTTLSFGCSSLSVCRIQFSKPGYQMKLLDTERPSRDCPQELKGITLQTGNVAGGWGCNNNGVCESIVPNASYHKTYADQSSCSLDCGRFRAEYRTENKSWRCVADPTGMIFSRADCFQQAQGVPSRPPTPIPPPGPCTNNICKTAIGEISTEPVGFVKSIFTIILSLSGGIALLLIILSGYKLMFSQGNPEKAQEAKETLTAAIVGLLFIIFSLVILQVIGVDILRIPGFDR